MFPQLTNSMVLAKQKSMHLVLNMFVFTRTLVTYARAIFKPRCCLNFQSMRTQAESTDIAHNMFGQIKMEIPWYINRHTLISRKRDGMDDTSRLDLPFRPQLQSYLSAG